MIHDYKLAKAVASVLKTHFKRAQGSLLGVLAVLMQQSASVEHIVDLVYGCKVRVARFPCFRRMITL